MTSLVVTCLEGSVIAGVYPRKVRMEPAKTFGEPVLVHVDPLVADDLPSAAFILGRNEAKPLMVTTDRSIRISTLSKARFQVTVLGVKSRVRMSAGSFNLGWKPVGAPREIGGGFNERVDVTSESWFLIEAPLD